MSNAHFTWRKNLIQYSIKLSRFAIELAMQCTCIHKWFTINLEIIPSDYGQFTFIYFLWRVIPLSSRTGLFSKYIYACDAMCTWTRRWCEKVVKILQLKQHTNIIRMSPLGNAPFKKKSSRRKKIDVRIFKLNATMKWIHKSISCLSLFLLTNLPPHDPNPNL